MSIKVLSFTSKSTLILSVLVAFFFISGISITNAQAEETVEETSAEAAPAADPALAAAGETIFRENCRSCHNIGSVKTGPALKDVTKRRSNEWLKSWISNPDKMIKSGDATAKELYGKFKSAGVMTSFPFEDSEFDQLLAYLAVAEVEGPKVDDSPTPGPTGAVQTDDSSNTLILTVVLVVLVLIIGVLVLLSSVLVKTLRKQQDKGDLDEDDVEILNQKHDVVKVLKHPAFIGLVVGLSLAVGLVWFILNIVYGIGVQQGYQPTQPIPFSHKIHAGEHEIDCNYCHTGVRKSKHANIPSASICMNCHVKVKTESPYIQDIYKAIDYNTETGEFGTNVKPIEWVRIHNLPDLVYFNHSQHVKVAGLECEECHGDIKNMEVVYQYSPLTMGWCIDCHRNKVAVTVDNKTLEDGTKVKEATNEYYSRLVELHEGSELTVEEIGGTECARCHY